MISIQKNKTSKGVIVCTLNWPSGLPERGKMENAGNYWTDAEDDQLKDLYVNYKMDITKLSKIHKRTENAIKKRLERLGVIPEFILNHILELNKRIDHLENIISELNIYRLD